MKVNEVGAVFKENVVCESQTLDATGGAVTLTDPGRTIRSLDGVSYCVFVENVTADVTLSASDGVVALSKTFTITEFDFTGMVGATITISGAAQSGNNGTFVISTVSSAHVIICTTASGLADETFSADVSLVVERTDAPLQATVTVEVSNNFVAAEQAAFGQQASPGNWTDVTAAFTPTPGAIDGPYDWYFQYAPLMAGAVRIGIAATDGMGVVSIYFGAKGSL